MITNILHEAGYKVGMFISPYLENFTERIQVELREIPGRTWLNHPTGKGKG